MNTRSKSLEGQTHVILIDAQMRMLKVPLGPVPEDVLPEMRETAMNQLSSRIGQAAVYGSIITLTYPALKIRKNQLAATLGIDNFFIEGVKARLERGEIPEARRILRKRIGVAGNEKLVRYAYADPEVTFAIPGLVFEGGKLRDDYVLEGA